MRITPPEKVKTETARAAAHAAANEDENAAHIAEFEEACAQFRSVCRQIAAFLHIDDFKGGFDEYAAMMNSPGTQADPTTANTLMHEWSGMNQLCTYLGGKIGLGQPAWWYRCWELEEDFSVSRQTP